MGVNPLYTFGILIIPRNIWCLETEETFGAKPVLLKSDFIVHAVSDSPIQHDVGRQGRNY